MPLNTWKRTFVSGLAAAGIAVGALAVTGPAAAAAPSGAPPVAVGAASVLATENLGLSNRQGKGVQRRLQEFGYSPGTIDGYLGANSWKAMQRALRDQGYGYSGAIDGIVGPNTVKALQRMLKDHWSYAGAIDGIAGSGTRAAFARFADYCVALYGY
jgi:peptidoglycan hydrolase-like protein with peptidoglycan-binding domain